MEQDTLIIVGAGGSVPHGFPNGEGLVGRILGSHRDGVINMADELGHSPKHTGHFCNSLRDSLSMSVDAFLETRTEFLDVGRIAIAFALLGNENPEYVLRPMYDEGWYHLLFEAMHSPERIEDFGRRIRGILTFNYDRSLEFAIQTAFRSAWDPTPEQFRDAFRRVPVLHLYGSLGPPLELWDPDHRFKPDIDPASVKRAADGIRIIHDENAVDDKVFQEAGTLIARCNNIAFIGFGFNRTNVQRLFSRYDLPVPNTQKKNIYATVHGLTESQVNWNVRPLLRERIKSLSTQDVKAKQFMLDNNMILFPRVPPV